MNLRCALFGHKPIQSGSQSRIGAPYYDGIGRVHRHIEARCARCDQFFPVGHVIDPALRPEPLPRPTHHVHRGAESMPCYCAATQDHAVGSELPHATVPVNPGDWHEWEKWAQQNPGLVYGWAAATWEGPPSVRDHQTSMYTIPLVPCWRVIELEQALAAAKQPAGSMQESGQQHPELVYRWAIALDKIKATATTPPPAPAAEQGTADEHGRPMTYWGGLAQPEARGVEAPAEDCTATEWLDFVNGTSVENLAAALATPNPVRAEQPEGKWKPVPVEPTREMQTAGKHALKGAADSPEWQQSLSVYGAMLAAAPAASGAPEPELRVIDTCPAAEGFDLIVRSNVRIPEGTKLRWLAAAPAAPGAVDEAMADRFMGFFNCEAENTTGTRLYATEQANVLNALTAALAGKNGTR